MANFSLSIQVPEAQIRDIAATLDHEAAKRIIVSAINEVLRSGVAQIAREVQKQYPVKIKQIKEIVNTVKANFRSLVGTISIRGKLIPLNEIKGTKAGKRGVTARPRLDKPPLKLPHSFKATMKSGHTGIFVRKRLGSPVLTAKERTIFEAGLAPRSVRYRVFNASKSGIARRLPIAEVFSQSILKEVGEVNLTDTGQRIFDALQNKLIERIASKVEFELSKRRKAA